MSLPVGIGVGERVKSPTYSLIETYRAGALDAHHLDLYRIADAGELEWLGLADLWTPRALVLVEWPERGTGSLPPADLVVHFRHAGDRREVVAEPLAVAWHAVRKSGVGRRETAVVVGCGPIGLAVILMLKARGVRHVVASDFSAARRRLAEQCGADLVVDPAAESPWASFEDSKYFTAGPPLLDLALGSVEKLRAVPFLPWSRVLRAAEAAGQTPRGPVVFECVGMAGLIERCVEHCAPRGTVVVVGLCTQPDHFKPFTLVSKEVRIQPSAFYEVRDFETTLDVLDAGITTPEAMITDHVDLPGLPDAFEALKHRTHQCKVMVNPWG